MRILSLASVLLLLCLAPSGHVLGDEDAYVDDVYGFRIDRPDGWTFSKPTPPAGALAAFKLAQVKDGTETSITVYVIEHSESTGSSADARNAAEHNWKQNTNISNISSGKAKYAGKDACWLKASYDAGSKYTLRQHFLIGDDFAFILQSLAPESIFKSAEKDFEPILKSFDFVPIDKDRATLLKLAERCGSEINFAQSWQQAVEQAKTEDKLVLVVFEVYRGVIEGRFTTRSLFMHPQIVEIVNERFVPWFWSPGSAPFDDARVFGLGPSTFGNGIMFADTDGRIIAQATTLDAYHVYDRCREVLKEHPGKPAGDGEAINELIRRGDLEVAEELLATPEGEDGWKLAFELHRRKRHSEAALEAHAQGDCSDFEEALIHINTGEFEQAEELLEDSADPRGMFFHCVSVAQQKGFDAVKPKLRKIALEHQDNRWAWLSAAILTEPRLVGVLDAFTWPSAEQVHAWAIPTSALEPDIEKSRQGAIDFLLKHQSPEGFWTNPRSNRSGLFDTAIASICAVSLLPHRDNDAVLAALEKANEYVVGQEFKLDPELLFDYGIWAEVFALDFLARCNEHAIGDRRKNKQAMNAIIKDMQTNQYPGGGWGYFHSADIPDNTIGFVTAPAILALQRAGEHGAKVPPSMIEKALESIAVLHHEGGSFGYMWATGPTREGREAEAAQRSPLYALALHRGGQGDEEMIRKALDVYLKHHKHTRLERGKTVCHTGNEGTAAYYLLFGYRYAAEAVRELPDDEQQKYRKALLDDLKQYRLSDGSYCDYPSVGREYGAGLALTTLDLLGD